MNQLLREFVTPFLIFTPFQIKGFPKANHTNQLLLRSRIQNRDGRLIVQFRKIETRENGDPEPIHEAV